MTKTSRAGKPLLVAVVGIVIIGFAVLWGTGCCGTEGWAVTPDNIGHAYDIVENWQSDNICAAHADDPECGGSIEIDRDGFDLNLDKGICPSTITSICRNPDGSIYWKIIIDMKTGEITPVVC